MDRKSKPSHGAFLLDDWRIVFTRGFVAWLFDSSVGNPSMFVFSLRRLPLVACSHWTSLKVLTIGMLSGRPEAQELQRGMAAPAGVGPGGSKAGPHGGARMGHALMRKGVAAIRSD